MRHRGRTPIEILVRKITQLLSAGPLSTPAPADAGAGTPAQCEDALSSSESVLEDEVEDVEAER